MNRRLCPLVIWSVVLGISSVRAAGPDRGGYRWIDSDEPGGPQFEWIDISGSGTPIALGDDDNQGPFVLGFSCDFYGHRRDSIRVCSNGWLSFNSESHQFHHYPIPDARDPNSLLASLWVDLDPAQGGSVLYLADTSHGRFVVSWIDVPLRGTGDNCTFQAILDTGGSVLFQYLRLPARFGADSCSVGIEDDSGLTGLEYLHDGFPEPNRLHDSLAVRFYRLQQDVCPSAILRPTEHVMAGDSIAPLVVVWNAGLSPASFPVTLKIGSGYEEQLTVTGLAALRDTQLEFPVWVPAAEPCTVALVTTLAGDEYPANDTMWTRVIGSYMGELAYDDGQADTWFLRNGSPTADWAGAVKFKIPYSRYRLLGARVFAAETLPFARVLVCPDSSGAPGLGSPYLQVESVRVRAPQTWLDVSADTQVTTSEDLWLVAFWPRRATGPRIGEDRDEPIDGRTYFGSPTVRWLPYADGDLLARLRIDGRAGICELPPAQVDRFSASPNPFRARTNLVLSLPAGSSAAVTVFDALGQRVRDLSLARPDPDGRKRRAALSWDGRDQNGRLLSAGAYFIEARAGNERRVAQVLLAR